MPIAHDAVTAALRLEQAKEFLDQGAFGKALAILARPLPAAFRPECAFLTAESLRGQGYLARAALRYRGLLRQRRGSDRTVWLDSCLGLVCCLRSLGEVRAARRFWEMGRTAAVALGNRGFRERLELEGALIDRAAGRYGRSLSRFKILLARFRSGKDWAAAGYVLWAMGGALRFAGDLEGSRRAFLASLAMGRRARDSAGKVYAWFGLGGVTRIQGRLAEARRYYAEALREVAGTEDVFGQAYAQCGLANVLRQQGELLQAERHYRLAHKLYTRLEDPVDLAYVDWGLGQIALRRGELAAADKSFRLALQGFLRGGEMRGVVLSEVARAQVLHALGHTGRAERIFAGTLRRARRAGIHTHLEIFT